MKREHPHRRIRPRALRLTTASVASTLIATSTIARAQVTTPPSSGDRVLGLDVSAWQGNITTTNWNGLHSTDHRDFVFIRSSRGGTTGYYDQNDSGNVNGLNTYSQRYDDPYFVQNINRATSAGLLAGPYHFGRMDIIETTKNSGGIANTGTDEANHFMEMAGSWMRPGYLLPTFDFEAGASQRTASQLAQFAIDFSNRIYAVKGIRPMVYIGNNYASPMNSIPESAALVAAMPNLWSARWPNQANPNAIDTQGTDPGDYTSTVYGPWDNSPNPPDPWHFWQYASTGGLQSFGGSSLDVDVAHGNIEYLKDHQVPALWITAGDGQWTTLANWNSGQTAVAPVYGPGQVAPVGTQTLPTVRLPGANDNVDLNRPNDNVTVTLSSGAQTVRRINLNERLNVTGGSLTASLTGQVGSGGTLSISGGASVTFTQGYVNNGGVLDFAGGGTLNVGTLFLSGNATFTGASGTGQILAKSGVASPLIDLGGGTRTLTVAEGSASTDMLVALPLSNGNLTKDGAGTLELTGNNSAYSGGLTIANGYLLVSATNQLGTTGVKTTQTSQAVGGSVRVSGNALNINSPITIGGLGANNSGGALENVSGSNTWSGPILLGGLNNNQNETGLNQIGAAAGTTLTLLGVIANNTSSASWAKVGAGDLVLSGGSANTYSGLTRLFDGRLIIEKDGALGPAGAPGAATGNTFQLAGSASTFAFRMLTGSGFSYSTFEVINTEGTGAPGFAQVDNLAGANSFAGQIAFGGPTVLGVITSTIGVTSGSLDLKGGLYARGTSGTRSITKLGAGMLIVSGASGAATANPSVVPLTDSTFSIAAGTVDLRGATPATQLLPGVTTWNVDGGATLSNTGGTLAGATVNAAAGGTMNFSGGNTNLGALNLAGGTLNVSAGGSKVLRTNALSITAGGEADLADNDAIVDYSGASPLAAVTGYLQSGRNGGSWNGPGLNTSQPDAPTGLTALGVAEASEALGITATQTGVWNAQSVDGTSVLVMYTYAGDATLDGKIDVDDYGRIDFNANLPGVAGWFNGDFNYDGKINVDDYGIIDFNVGVQGPPLAGIASPAALSAVPEPSTLLIVALPLLSLAARKRKAPRR